MIKIDSKVMSSRKYKVILFFCIGVFSLLFFLSHYSVSAGTIYEVSSCADLQEVDNAAPYNAGDIIYLTASFSCDVKLGDVSDFVATFDGQGNTITLTGDDSLFGTLSGATVQDLILAGDIDGGGSAYVSALANTAENETLIYRVGVIADITNSSSYSAGFVYLLNDSVIRDSFHTGSVGSTGSYTAGFASFVLGGSVIERVFSEGVVSGASYVGGIAGLLDRVGSPQIIRDSFFSGSVTSTNNLAGAVAGLVDDILSPDESDWLIDNYYNADSIGDDICAQASPDVTSTPGVCVAVNTGGDPDPFYFLDNNSNEPMASWDFENVWYAQTPHPRLAVSLSPGTSIPGAGSSFPITPQCLLTAEPAVIEPGQTAKLFIEPNYTGGETTYYTQLQNDLTVRNKFQKNIEVQPETTTEYVLAIVNARGANYCNATVVVSEKQQEEIKTVVVKEDDSNVKDVTPRIPQECSPYLDSYIHLNRENNKEDVVNLEKFLNQHLDILLPVNGVYEKDDYDAVVMFQELYPEDILKPWRFLTKGTGYVYKTTTKKINELMTDHCY